jgi:putative transposase
LMLSAKRKWRKLDGQNRLSEINQGIEFRDGIKHEIKAARSSRHQLSGIAH